MGRSFTAGAANSSSPESTEKSLVKQVSTRLGDGDVAALQELADADGRSLANYVKIVLQRHLAEVRGQDVEA